uniref:Retrovirus-related Pol polyprotein from transposon TNT 1-94 n=1 Tax=Tanacetum cinerariifolium TaxID=118510 RepID=A0A699HYU9_TANCI|nr:hypothetical protein [Tanacetum cinerariifolium]
MCHILGIEPQFENIIKNGPFIPMTTGQRKPEGQWTGDERKAINLHKRLKSLIMSVLPNDQMNSVINCLTTKSTWDDMILYHKGPSDVKECTGNTNHVKDSELASIFGKLKYEENLIDSIYETKKNKYLISTTPLATAFISTSIVKDFQDSPGDEEDTRSSHEYLNDLEEEYQARALLPKSKRLFKKDTQRFSSAKATDQTEYHNYSKKGHFTRDYWSKASVPSYQSPFQPKALNSSQHKLELRPTKEFKAKYNKVKAKLALLSSSALASKAVKVLMALAEENDAISKVGTRNGEWVKISIRKRILGVDQLTEDPSSSGQKDIVFVKSSTDDTKVSIPSVERQWLSKAKGFILPNHDTGRILLAESQRNTTDPSVDVTDSSMTDYDSVDESSVCSTPFPPLKKMDVLNLFLDQRLSNQF